MSADAYQDTLDSLRGLIRSHRGGETARERWLDNSLNDAERLLAYLQYNVKVAVCLRELRSRLGFENVRGRVDDLRTRGYAIDGADALPLCGCDGKSWGCRGSQLYRLKCVDPVQPPREKSYGGSFYRDNWRGLVVEMHKTDIADTYTDEERAFIERAVRAALEHAEDQVEYLRAEKT